MCSIKKQYVLACKKIAVEMCGPKGCGYSEGPEVCKENVKTVIFDKPEEVCKLDPRVSCKFVTKLVPQLKEVESCMDVPKEVCVKKQKNPHVVRYPVVKTWCYAVLCPDKCRGAAMLGQCNPDCQDYKNLPGCECEHRQAAAPAYYNQPCPARCTSRRVGECSMGGVEKCGNKPGCCPEKYNLLFGEAAFFGEQALGYGV